MIDVAETLAPCKSKMDTSGERDLLMAALRSASARIKLAGNALDHIGVALRQKAITCDGALTWAREEGLLDWIRLGPEANNNA